ncbi:3-oxoacyl-ACP synthase III [bacterium (Candidatus Blackallbacteria) CG17_big_fil_post_rev_8_21_14_2_50_48_46]|uniref:3-oxoacyl-ACP synthase III n=1 Tax=bacterium (Candidatus Blackallbacteria) CG17_big_fil_post_rev_8_21_14_2_50_48_46 TaxID=2014261 RepID=A0A2M7FYC5_9BACT|nr:MAG: 3-oxoacyl-ACP synthase III [bacterium (Candidatus Blackallbacteria) CG18_big_fil_WC_8_21_14_2_50_49_26]PIW14228.1 MAG: 3-oxoacyl-ACP synthase III [bacterium (Candidatus Blackallbacteria) CG17_big_fil_post_rev_8_21_14_2_50_48_46]PIW46967.1 MAG: 3-oxoacyl-ACP synthase III [bacterium (Candidatus Blackallbacteria) CG13_big_fil_rev_8_21_14_2_50_49_14]
MYFDNVSILGMGYVDAPHRISSASIEEQLKDNIQRFGMRPNLIESLTGISARRFWDPGVQPSDAATQASVRALEDAGIPKDKIGVLISTSVSKDFIEPSVAALVHGNLGLKSECLNFDVGNACLAFLNAMTIAGNMIERGQVDYALVVCGESSRDIVEHTLPRLQAPDVEEKYFRDRFATLTLGSGGVAMVLTHSRLAPEGHRFLGGVSLAATHHSRLCLGQNHDMTTDASTLLMAGLQLAAETYERAKEQQDWHKKDFRQYIMHQVGEVHLRKCAEILNVPHEKVPRIFPEFGNVGPASIPLTLAKVAEQGEIQAGDRVAFMGIGSGLNCAMMEVLW